MARGHRKKSGDRSGRQGQRAKPGAPAPNGVDYRGASKEGCTSGKWAWPNTETGRASARTLKRALRKAGGPGAAGVREYLCGECARWHVGHLPGVVRRGETGAADLYGRRL